ncbi:MAG: alpha-2-macroglobulin family protein, partial [Caulobacterales bacterium]
RVAEGARAAFDVIAVDAAGKRVAAKGVAWTLVEEDWSYDWYLDGGQWRWRRTGRDVPVAAGSIDVPADKPVQIARDKMRAGQYRLILVDDAGGAQTSARFAAGWTYSAGGENEAPDTVAVAPPVEAVKAGSNVRVQIKAPYAGEAQIAIATDRVLSMKTMRVPEGGATLNLRADPSWGSGVYVLVTVMTPRSADKLPVPRRAVGVAYVPIDMGPRTLKVALPEKQVLRPRQTVNVPVTIVGAPGGEKVRITLAAVDEGILQLTKFESPDPAKFYFGRKALGVAIRDDYGRLLNPNLGAPSIPRQGGDSLGGEGLTVVPTKTVALFSGLVRVGRDGKAMVPLALPDFNGELRLMAVAWSESAVGAASQAATVRDPVVAELTLPRFLAPGDTADATLELSNVEGPAGAYRVTVSPSGAVSGQTYSQSFQLAAKAQSRTRVALKGAGAGIGQVLMTLEGPGGLKIERGYQIQSRTPFMPLTLTKVDSQAAGASFALNRAMLDAFAAGEGKALVSFSPLRGIDAAPLLDVLDRYPYGCSEQLTSTTLPLLYANALAQTAQKPTDPQLRRRVQESVDKLLDRQGSDGAFGLWRAEDRAASPWLGAYVTDFLRRAKAAGYVVPAAPLDAAYKALRSVARLDDFASVSYDFDVYAWPGNTDSKERLRSRSAAYALYVLAKAGKADLGEVRYFHDAKLKDEASPLARAQIGAALAHLGDRARSKNAFKLAESALGYRNTGDYYQSPLRDLAAVLALAAEAGDPELVERLSARLERDNREPESLTTQEQAQLLVAVDALLARAKGPMTVSVNGAPMMGAVASDAARLAQGLVFKNDGQGPVFRTLTLSGIPKTAPGATSQGFSLDKRFFRMNGAAADPTALRQGERVVVVLSGATQSERLHPSVLVDLLPAGLEIESVLKPADGERGEPEGSDGAFAWVGRITEPRVAEARDDRFVAAADLRSESFTFAYVARAVTPGAYILPAAQIEDMYRPGVIARTSVGRLGVAPGS